MLTDHIKKIVQRRDLSEEEMTQAMTEIMSGEASEAQIGAFMGALAKGRLEELRAARAMRRKTRIHGASTTSTP
jgi:anthranilate phosphoribosyltransferase